MPTQAVSLTPAYALPIVAGNAVPLLGVLIWDWRVFDLMLLYWMENLVIGALTITAMVASGLHRGADGMINHIVLGVFFFFHYAIFCMGHGALLFSLFHETGDEGIGAGFWAPLAFIHAHNLWQEFIWALGGLIVVQTIRLARDWPKLRTMEPGKIMGYPYSRIVILHITLIFGGLLIRALGQPVLALILLIALKTGVDLNLFALIKKMKPPAREYSHDA